MTETTLTPGQQRIQNMAQDLHLAEQHLCRLKERLQSAAMQFEAAVNGDSNRLPCQQQMKTAIDEALREMGHYTSELAYAFEKPVIQALLKSYRCQEEGKTGD